MVTAIKTEANATSKLAYVTARTTPREITANAAGIITLGILETGNNVIISASPGAYLTIQKDKVSVLCSLTPRSGVGPQPESACGS